MTPKTLYAQIKIFAMNCKPTKKIFCYRTFSREHHLPMHESDNRKRDGGESRMLQANEKRTRDRSVCMRVLGGKDALQRR